MILGSNKDSPMVKLRKLHSVRQNQMAKIGKVSSSTLSEVERGLRDIPEVMLENLAELGVDTDVLAADHAKFMEQVTKDLKSAFQKSVNTDGS